MANEQSQKQPKVVGGINWSTRLKSKTFWVAMISALALFANQVTGAFGIDYSAQIEQIVSIIGSILTLLAGVGIIVENNTKGLKDSGIVKTYTKPRNEHIDPVQFQQDAQTQIEDISKQNVLDKEDLGIYTPVEYENPEPDTDDSDEVVAGNQEEVTEDPSVNVTTDKPLGSKEGELVDTTKNVDNSIDSSRPISKGGQK